MVKDVFKERLLVIGETAQCAVETLATTQTLDANA